MKTTGEYIISGGIEGKNRLNTLSDILQATTMSLLEANGVKLGASLLDTGCGGGNVSLLAAKMVGDNGNVTAIDFDTEIIALDKQDAINQNVSNIEYHAMSAYDINFKDEFDVAYSRFLLSHLTTPLEVLQKMVQSVKPGGRIIVEDIQFSGHFCHPACQAFDDYITLFTATAKLRGQNADIGPYLFDLFHAAGIKDINFEVIQPSFSKGPGKWMAYITMDKIKDAVVQQGLADMPAINTILNELEAFTNDEQTIISLPRIFRVWGVKA
jgi:ubiquinone/menaquinone biosynthesis C-methylase UbiE